MMKMIPIAVAMLLSLSTYVGAAGEGPGAVDSANLLPALTDTQRWLLMNPSRVSEATVVLEDGALRVDITKVKSEPARGDLSLGCMRVPGKAGKAYNLRFTAKASDPRQITISAFEPGKPEESIIGQAATELKTTWQTYVCRIVLTRDCTLNTRIPSFEFGDKVGSIWFRNVTLVPADGAAPTPSAAAAPAGSASHNLLSNAMSPEQWIISQKGSAKGTVEQQENQLRVNVTAAATDRWSFRLQHRAIDTTPGQSLTLKFSARASAPRKIIVSSQQGLPPMGDLTEETVLDLGTEWQEYTCKFAFPKGSTAANDLFPIIELGDQIGVVTLRDISLTSGETRTAPEGAAHNPAGSAPPSALERGPSEAAQKSGLTSIPDMTKEGLYRFVVRRGQGGVVKEGDTLKFEFASWRDMPFTTLLTYDNQLAFLDGKSYRLKFSAKAAAPMQIKIVAKDKAPYAEDYSTPVPVPLTAQWQEFDVKLNVARFGTGEPFTLCFDFGDKPGTIWMRNMSINPE